MDCFWCSKGSSSSVLALQKLCSADASLKLQDEMQKDLIDCYYCVLAYHSAKNLFLKSHQEARQELLTWEIIRLSDHLKKVLHSKSSVTQDTETFEDFFQEEYTLTGGFGFGHGEELQSKLSIPLREILNFPSLLWDKELAKLATDGLISLEEAGSPLILDGKLPGIYLLLVHPSSQIRKWARKTVRSLGPVSCDDYDDLSDVVKWIMGVAEFGLFQCPYLGDDPSTMSSYTILPSHLFVRHPVKEFWLGVCVFLKSLEARTVRLQLVSRGNHQAFIDIVVNGLSHANAVDKETAQGHDSEFWPFLHCFVIFLERLGARIWQYVSLPDAQMEVFRLITLHPAYKDELMHWPGFNPDDPLTSQESDRDYVDGQRRQRRSPDRARPNASQSSGYRRYTVVFAWFKPYLKSVVDFGDVGAKIVKAVLKYLHGLKGEYRLSSEGYDSTMAALICCLDHLLRGSLSSYLLIASNLWIPDLIELLSLKGSEHSRGRKLAMEFCKSVMDHLLQNGVNVSQYSKWFEDTSSFVKLESDVLRGLQTILQNFFKGDPSSPPDTRQFARERRMIVAPSKNSRRLSGASTRSGSGSPEEGSSPMEEKRQYKFVMSSKSSPGMFSVSPKTRMKTKRKTKTKSSHVSGSRNVKKETREQKGKTIPDYFNKSPILDARVKLEKLKVKRKSDGEGNLSDVLIVDSSDDFVSDSCAKEKLATKKHKRSKLSLTTKKEVQKKTKKEKVSQDSSFSSSSSSKAMASKSFYGGFTGSQATSSAKTLARYDDKYGRLDASSSEEFLDSIDVKPSRFQLTKADTSGRNKDSISREPASVKSKGNKQTCTNVRIKTEKDYIVISDDSSSDSDLGWDNDSLEMIDKIMGKSKAVKREEPSDTSFMSVDEDPRYKIKDEPVDLEQHIKTKKPDGSDFDCPVKTEVKTEENNYLISYANVDDTRWIFSDDNDDDAIMRCLDARDSLDTMTCVEADLSELPDECDVMKVDDVAGDLKSEEVDHDGDNDANDESDDSDLSEEFPFLKTNTTSQARRKKLASLSSTVHETDDHEGTIDMPILLSSDTEELRPSDEGPRDVKTERDDRGSCDIKKSLTAAEVAPAGDAMPAKRLVSDSSSPETTKDTCFKTMFSKTMFSKLKSFCNKTNATQPLARSEGSVSERPEKGVDVETSKKEAGIEPFEKALKVDSSEKDTDVELSVKGLDDKRLEKVANSDGNDQDQNDEVEREENAMVNIAGINYEEQDMDMSTGCDSSVGNDASRAEHSDKGGNKADTSDAKAVFKDGAKVGIVRPLLFSKGFRAAETSSSVARSATGATNVQRVPATLVSRNIPKVANQKRPEKKGPRIIETNPKSPLTLEEFYCTVLRWDADLLHRSPIGSPYILNHGKVRRPFESMDQYYKTFKPLVFLEVWAQVAQDWKARSRKSGQKQYTLIVDSMDHFVTDFQLIKCKLKVEVTSGEAFLQESDLVILELKDGTSATPRRSFALVDNLSKERSHWQPGDETKGCPTPGGKCFEFTITLRLLTSARRPVAREVLRCVFVTSLVTFIRQWKGLMFLPRSLLARDILWPRVAYCGINDLPSGMEKLTSTAGNMEYNDSQLASIERTCEAMRKPFPIPRICFIQGPPGTGKSHTIIGLIKKHLKNRATDLQAERENQLPGSSTSNAFSQASGRILLCAPSNAAVDVLVRRLIAEMRESEGNLGSVKGKNCGSINLVRVGRASAIHPQVQPFTLDVLSKSQVAKLTAGDAKEEEAVKKDLDNLRGEIDRLEKDYYLLRCAGHDVNSSQVIQRNSEIDELVKKKKQVERQYGDIRARTKIRQREEAKIKTNILFSADIICSTLSGSGSTLLHKELLKNTRKQLPFGCVIVDEACQSCELDVLIPLQFGCSKLVMVGDPEQLRTTILSKKAQELFFGQSLYERHYKVFRERARQNGLPLHMAEENPVQMLGVQYRMHPDIAEFPSSYVYQGRVKNAKSVVTRQPVCALKPYVLLNVLNGREESSPSGSICNPVECDLVVEICCLLRGSLRNKHFGIITPYRAQVTLIERSLRERGMEKIEVNTVDGFQGREKEVIIMSCVRANGQAKGIGFLADRQRMNVALTRARHALVILMNAKSLVTNRDWKSCIENAQLRGSVQDVTSSKDLNLAFVNDTLCEVAPDMLPGSPSDRSPVKVKPLNKPLETMRSKTEEIGTGPVDPRRRPSVTGPKTVSDSRLGEVSSCRDKSDPRLVLPNKDAAIGRKKGSGATDLFKMSGTSNDRDDICKLNRVAKSHSDMGSKDGTKAQEVKDRVNIRSEQRPRVGMSSEVSSSRDDRRRKNTSDDEAARERHRSEGQQGTLEDSGRKEKKRKMDQEGTSGAAENQATSGKCQVRESSLKRDDRNHRGKGEGKGTVLYNRGMPSSCVLKSVMVARANKRKREDIDDASKHRKETGASSSGTWQSDFSDGNKNKSIKSATHAHHVVEEIRSEEVSTGHGNILREDGLAQEDPILSQISDDRYFDFDEYEPDAAGVAGTNGSSCCDEQQQGNGLGSSRSRDTTPNFFSDELLDEVMRAGGNLLAMGNPYLYQLASHEQRTKPARRASVPPVKPSTCPKETPRVAPTEKEIPASLLSFVPAPPTRSISMPARPATSLNKAPRDRSQPSGVRPGNDLDDVVKRVKARNPARPPPKVISQSDSLDSFRHYHGGPRDRVAHAKSRNPHLSAEYARSFQARNETTVRHRNRTAPNAAFEKIRKAWKKNRI